MLLNKLVMIESYNMAHVCSQYLMQDMVNTVLLGLF